MKGYNRLMRLFHSWIRKEMLAFAALERERQIGFPLEIVRRTSRVVEAVRRDGDAALVRFTARFDGVKLSRGRIRVPRRAFRAAWRALAPEQRRALAVAWRNIVAFHSRQRPRGYGMRTRYGILRQVIRPLDRVGIHVSAMAAPLVSSLLMCAGAARAAGVKGIALASPPRYGGGIAVPVLAGAYVAGIDEGYAVGGAQGVAALALGTRTVPAVDKVVGPGNLYVQAAKMLTQGGTGLEGPSEILVLADDSAPAAGIAADLIAQGEHTGDNWVVLVSPSKRLVLSVLEEVRLQLRGLPRAGLAASSLIDKGAIVMVRSLQEGLDIANRFAPEHLEIVCRNAKGLVAEVRSAGTILVGGASPVAAADYGVGPNHVLPTAGTARFASGLGVKDFVKTVNVTELTSKGLRAVARDLAELARMEGLEGHARSMLLDRG